MDEDGDDDRPCMQAPESGVLTQEDWLARSMTEKNCRRESQLFLDKEQRTIIPIENGLYVHEYMFCSAVQC